LVYELISNNINTVWLVQKGLSIYEVSKLLGYADIKTTQIYAHLRSDELCNAVERLE